MAWFALISKRQCWNFIHGRCRRQTFRWYWRLTSITECSSGIPSKICVVQKASGVSRGWCYRIELFLARRNKKIQKYYTKWRIQIMAFAWKRSILGQILISSFSFQFILLFFISNYFYKTELKHKNQRSKAKL